MDDKKLKIILQDIYDRFFKAYGPQHWWPAERRFEMIVGAILTQSAAWSNVVKAINNLKTANKLSPRGLRETPEEELAHLVFPTGYYNAKARKLKAFTGWLGENYDDDLDRLYALDTGKLRSELLGVYGIGEETADSIILYSAYKPIFVIDAYTRRLIDRLGLTPRPAAYTDYQKLFMSALPHEVPLFNEYHALIVRHAKEACLKKPLCDKCCLNTGGKSAPISIDNRFPCRKK